jgi:hypothetical protein
MTRQMTESSTGLDHLGGVVAREGVDGLSLDVQVLLGQHRDVLVVQRATGSIERAAEHLLGDGHLKRVTLELAASVCVVNAGCALENLHDGHVAVCLKDGTLADLTVAERDVDDLGIFGELRRRVGRIS